MGDTHFILRHALTGAVFLLFFGIGCWAAERELTEAYLRSLGAEDLSHVLTLAVSSAIVGITIQGAHIGFLVLVARVSEYISRKWPGSGLTPRQGPFADRARQIVKAKVFGVFESDRYEVPPEDRARAKNTDADAYFVWLYHRLAPNELIEWARRRRSYFYLGKNWAIACVLGWLLGIAWMEQLRSWSHETAIGWAAVASLVWVFSAWRLADRMKRDVDEMEFLWAAARVNPKLRAKLTQDLQPQDDTKLSGKVDVRLKT